MILIPFIEKFEDKKGFFLLFLFLTAFVFRFPTLFNDYYDGDILAAIVQTREYLAGAIPGVDFSESKHFLYHLIFKGAYKISYNYGWVLVHLANIIIIYLTSVFIFLSGQKLKDFKTGAYAAILYAVLISSFNRNFMATNAEVIYNLFFAAGLYFLVRAFLSVKIGKILFFLLSLSMGYAAYGIKFHGIIWTIFLGFFIFLYLPYFKGFFSRKIIISIFAIMAFSLIILIIDYNFTGYLQNILWKKISHLIYYASAPERGFSIFQFLYRFTHKQGMLLLWHMVLWVPVFIYMWYFIKRKFKSETIEESVFAVFFLVTYLMIFGGGARLYFHYFVATYVPLTVLAAIAISDLQFKKIEFVRKRLLMFILIPGIFFLSWNTKDIIIKHFYPNAFHDEGKFLYWTRAVLVGSLNGYLLVNPNYKDVIPAIKKNSDPGDRIFVWGHGPQLNYFSNRRLGGTSMWLKNSLHTQVLNYKSSNIKLRNSSIGFQKWLCRGMEKRNVELFIDTFENGMSSFHIPLKDAPIVEKYVKDKYNHITTVNKMKIYKRKQIP